MKIVLIILLATFAACRPSEDFSSDAPGSEERAERSVKSGEPGGLASSDAPMNQPRIRFARSRAAADAGTFVTTFKLLAQRDIVVGFQVPIAMLSPGATLMQFEVLNPDGVTHASKWYALTTEDGAPAMIKHPSFGLSVPVQRANTVGPMAHFFGKIPIAGTNFTRYRLHGEFTATLRVGIEESAEPTIVQSFEVQL